MNCGLYTLANTNGVYFIHFYLYDYSIINHTKERIMHTSISIRHYMKEKSFLEINGVTHVMKLLLIYFLVCKIKICA